MNAKKKKQLPKKIPPNQISTTTNVSHLSSPSTIRIALYVTAFTSVPLPPCLSWSKSSPYPSAVISNLSRSISWIFTCLDMKKSPDDASNKNSSRNLYRRDSMSWPTTLTSTVFLGRTRSIGTMQLIMAMHDCSNASSKVHPQLCNWISAVWSRYSNFFTTSSQSFELIAG